MQGAKVKISTLVTEKKKFNGNQHIYKYCLPLYNGTIPKYDIRYMVYDIYIGDI
jgi:hypothetical protein